MFESFATTSLRRRCPGLAVLFLALVSAGAATCERGQYGGDLNLLRSYYTPPRDEGESNFYFDLWSPSALPVLARVNGLTNNNALIVDSHGKAGCSTRGSGYGFYPNPTLLKPGQRTPYYSARDFAEVMGPDHAAAVHNIVIAGCNEEGRFNPDEMRDFFPNATNITYMVAGQLSYKPMFYQAIVLPSSEIKTLFGKVKSTGGRIECRRVDGSVPGAKRLGAFVADLYLPGAKKSFRTQRAGRELLDPSVQASSHNSRNLPSPNWTPEISRLSGRLPVIARSTPCEDRHPPGSIIITREKPAPKAPPATVAPLAPIAPPAPAAPPAPEPPLWKRAWQAAQEFLRTMTAR